MRRIMVVTCVTLVLILSIDLIISPPVGDFIWTSKSTYCFGEYVEIYFGCSYGCMGEAEVVLCTPDGCSTRYNAVITDYDQIGGQAGPPAGKRTAKLYIDGDLVDTVTYWVEDCSEDEDPCIYMLCPDYECRGCDYYEYIGCENGECLFTLVERNSPKCGSGCGEEDCDNGRDDDGDGRVDCNDSDCRNDSDCDPCKNVSCSNKCYECDYHERYCDNGECVKGRLIEKDSSECGCEPEPDEEETIDEEEARKQLYGNYADALDHLYWNNRGTDILRRFGEEFYSSFTTPFGILKSTAKQAAKSEYASAELLTEELAALSESCQSFKVSEALGFGYTRADEYRFKRNKKNVFPPDEMRRISRMIEDKKMKDAENAIKDLCGYLQDTYSLISEADKSSSEVVKAIIDATLSFLDAECKEHGLSCSQSQLPEIEPEPEPEGGSCMGTTFISMLIFCLMTLSLMKRKVLKEKEFARH